MAMILYERGLLDLEMPVAAIVPEFVSAGSKGSEFQRNEVTLRMLLAHSSGLPAYEKLFLRAKNRDELLAAAFATPLAADPGARAEYSDIGFIILGVALERMADEPLDRFCQREIFGPLGMAHTAFNPPASWRDSIPPTADERTFRHRIIQGEVQDENASVLGGVAGHAGVFRPCAGRGNIRSRYVEGGAPILRPETFACSLAANPPPQALRAHWAGIRRLRPRSRANISPPVPLGTWDIPALRCGSTPNGSFRSSC